MTKTIQYIKDRYPVFMTDKDEKEFAGYYTLWLKDHGYSTMETSYGFINYKFEGDACIIQDLYVVKEQRKTKLAWTLFNQILDLARKNPKCTVLIATSEKIGINHADGVGAMLAAGFVKSQETDKETIYIRGTH